MNHPTTLADNQITQTERDTSVQSYFGEYLPYEYQKQLDPLLWPVASFSPGPYFGLGLVEDEMRPFMLMGARDALKELGPISKEDYDYYENL